MGVRKTGDWSRLDRMLSGIGRRFRANVGRATRVNGRLLQGAIATRIEDDKALGPRLSRRYRAWKIKHFGKEERLMLTETLFKSIRFHAISWDRGRVNILRREPRRGYDLALIHERGSRDGRIPARPYAAPSLQESQGRMTKNWEKAVADTFK